MTTPQVVHWFQAPTFHIPRWAWIAGLVAVAIIVFAIMRSVDSSSPSAQQQPVALAAPSTGSTGSPQAGSGHAAPAAERSVGSAQVPTAVEQKKAAEAAEAVAPNTGKGFAPGKYKLSQIKTSSSNVVVAFVAAAINQEQFPISLFGEDRFTPAKAAAFVELHKELKNPDKEDWLLVGSVQDILTGSFVSPGDAVPGVNYNVSIFFVSPCPECVGFRRIHLRLHKTSSGDWKLGSFSVSRYGLWNKDAFERELSKARNEPSKFDMP